MEDQDELDGQSFIRAEMEAKERQAQRDHEYRMARVARPIVDDPSDFLLVVALTAFITSIITGLMALAIPG